MSKLSDREIAQAAQEAGLTPVQLRQIMAERSASLPARVEENQRALIAPSTRGKVHGFVETTVPAPPSPALSHVRHYLERASGKRGHQQGKDQADIVDDQRGLVYRLRSESDGGDGSIVRVDIDVSPRKARSTYTAMVGGALSLFGAGAAFLFAGGWGTWLMWTVFATIFLGGYALVRKRSQGALKAGKATAQAAIVEASSHDVDLHHP